MLCCSVAQRVSRLRMTTHIFMMKGWIIMDSREISDRMCSSCVSFTHAGHEGKNGKNGATALDSSRLGAQRVGSYLLRPDDNSLLEHLQCEMRVICDVSHQSHAAKRARSCIRHTRVRTPLAAISLDGGLRGVPA